jgi:hypothetical protein
MLYVHLVLFEMLEHLYLITDLFEKMHVWNQLVGKRKKPQIRPILILNMQLSFSMHLWALIVDGSQDFFHEIFLVCTEYGDLVRPIDFKPP